MEEAWVSSRSNISSMKFLNQIEPINWRIEMTSWKVWNDSDLNTSMGFAEIEVPAIFCA